MHRKVNWPLSCSQDHQSQSGERKGKELSSDQIKEGTDCFQRAVKTGQWMFQCITIQQFGQLVG